MGCNTSQDQMAGAVQENKSSGVMKNGKLLNGNPKKLINNKNDNILLVEEYGQDEEFAATKIQAAFRGHKTRTAMKNSDIDSNSQSKVDDNNADAEPSQAELEAEFDPNDKELCDAAMKIQATFRGHLQRKLAGSDKDDIDVDIQEITKKVAEELDIDLTDPELNKAATKIQASFRGHQIRKQDH